MQFRAISYQKAGLWLAKPNWLTNQRPVFWREIALHHCIISHFSNHCAMAAAFFNYKTNVRCKKDVMRKPFAFAKKNLHTLHWPCRISFTYIPFSPLSSHITWRKILGVVSNRFGGIFFLFEILIFHTLIMHDRPFTKYYNFIIERFFLEF